MAKFRYQKQPEIYRIGSIQVQNLKKKKKLNFSLNGQISVPKATRNL